MARKKSAWKVKPHLIYGYSGSAVGGYASIIKEKARKDGHPTIAVMAAVQNNCSLTN